MIVVTVRSDRRHTVYCRGVPSSHMAPSVTSLRLIDLLGEQAESKRDYLRLAFFFLGGL